MGTGWDKLEGLHARALRAHFGLLPAFAAHREAIKQIDLVALATERRDLLPWQPMRHRPWPALDTPGQTVEPYDINLSSAWRTCQHWTEWRDAFLVRYEYLRDRIDRAQESACEGATQ